MLEVLPVLPHREVKLFPIWFYLTLLDNDVSMHILVVLVVVISTSPRISKTEFVCKRYHSFRIAMFPSLGWADNPAQNWTDFPGADFPALREADNPASLVC